MNNSLNNLGKFFSLRAMRSKPRDRKVDIWSWVWYVLGALYFILPLYATFGFSLEMKRDTLSFLAYQKAFADKNFWATFGYSNMVAVFTILVSLAVTAAAYTLFEVLLQSQLPKGILASLRF